MNQDIEEIISHTLDVEAKQIARLKETIDQDVLKKIIDMIIKCQGKVIITGCGTSAMAARKIVHSLSVIDIPSVFLNPSDAVHGSLGVVQEDDIVIFISKGGNTDELVSFIDNVRDKKAFVITVSENEGSILAKKCDLFLKVKIEREPDEYDMLATASTLCVIAVFDAVCIALMKYTGFSKEKFLLNHPKGAVGERLSRR
ncbi:MAG: SIS domain-containing protein [Erysipelotrichaceae bacterium]|nr:SIS domain-containing protein [Erysipelotrichaceae bacterium]